MQLNPSWRKARLLVHLVGSLAWLGAIAAYFALAVRGFTGAADLGTRAAYMNMLDVGWHVVVPLGVVSVATGAVQALGTPWGLLRNYWVIVKMGIGILALGIMLLHMGPTDELALAAAQGDIRPADLRGLRLQLVLDSAAALVVLLIAAALGVYKPRGQTPWTRPRDGAVPGTSSPGRWLKVLTVAAALAIAAILIAHLTGHSPHQH